MGPLFALATILAAIPIMALAQESQLAPEGRGLLPRPPAATPEASIIPHPFKPGPSGGFSRTVFETDEDPNFKIIVRDFSFPPDRQPHTISLPSGAFVHLLNGEGDISVAKSSLTLSQVSRTPVPAGTPIEVVNHGEQPVVIRALIVEAK